MYKFIHHVPYFIPLLGIFCLGLVGFATFSFDHYFQASIVISMGVAYVVWGVVYHLIHGNLSVMTVIEYIVIAIFGVAAVLTALG